MEDKTKAKEHGNLLIVRDSKAQRVGITKAILNDKSLGLKERGLLCTLCSLPDSWRLSPSGLASIMPEKAGEIEKVFISLVNAGYLQINGEEIVIGQEKKIRNPRYCVREIPIPPIEPVKEPDIAPKSVDNESESIGRKEMYDAIQKVVYGDVEWLISLFGDPILSHILSSHSADEFIEKVQANENTEEFFKDNFKAGDKVMAPTGEVYIIIGIENGMIECMSSNGGRKKIKPSKLVLVGKNAFVE